MGDGTAVDGVHVELIDVASPEIIAPGQLRVGMTLGTSPREI